MGWECLFLKCTLICYEVNLVCANSKRRFLTNLVSLADPCHVNCIVSDSIRGIHDLHLLFTACAAYSRSCSSSEHRERVHQLFSPPAGFGIRPGPDSNDPGCWLSDRRQRPAHLGGARLTACGEPNSLS